MDPLKLFVDLHHHFYKQLHSAREFLQKLPLFNLGLYWRCLLSRYVRATSFPIFCLFNHGASRGKIYKCGVRSKDFRALGKMKSKYSHLIPESLVHTSAKISSAGTVGILIWLLFFLSCRISLQCISGIRTTFSVCCKMALVLYRYSFPWFV